MGSRRGKPQPSPPTDRRGLRPPRARVMLAGPVARTPTILSALVTMLAVAGCERGTEATAGGAASGVEPTTAAPVERAQTLDELQRASCSDEIARVRREPALAGAPELEARRAHVLARAKGEPVLFERPPAVGEISPEARRHRERLRQSPSPYFAFHQLHRQIRGRRDVLREVMLTDGYLYSDSPDVATAMVELVTLPALFDAPELFIHRGADVLRATRKNRLMYEYADGPERGRPARLMLFDRVATTASGLVAPLHIDVRGASHRSGFDRLDVERITASAVLGRARFGSTWAQALFARQGVVLQEICALPEADQSARLQADRELVQRRRRVLAAQHAAILEQVDEALPFDEPRTEFGQQDGELRRAWSWAYRHGWHSYEVNDDHYQVFDLAGRPKVPQVCIDFVTDTFERASGTRWAPREEERRRVSGLLDFDTLGIGNRRSVEEFVKFSWQRPDAFDVVALSPTERIRFLERGAFFDHVYEHRDRYVPGDVVTIHGPKSDGEAHYHSFFVFEADPVSGMPTLLACNAGKPRIRTWDGVMRSAPLRSMKHRVRARLEWLEAITPPAQRIAERPSPLASSPI